MSRFARTEMRSKITDFKKIAGKVYRVIYKKPKARKEICRLYGENNASLKLLASVLSAVLENSTSEKEKTWIDKIELLRNELNTSSAEIAVMDYGAGSLNLNLMAGEMCQGRVITRAIGEVCRSASTSNMWAFLLFKLIREFKPSICLELGTCLGISTSYQAAALELNGHGKIVTLEGSESLASLSRENFKKLGFKRIAVHAGRFQDTLGGVLHKQGHIDFAFIDGHHDKQATLAYFEQIFPFLTEKAISVFDDISWSKGMGEAWNIIAADERVKASVDLGGVGICLFTNSLGGKKSFKVVLD
ncbi:MAG: O-methyltransferase [Thermodesulfobacteriota bacterium]